MGIFKMRMKKLRDSEILAETSRVEAYSDAIIAIIMTLLVLELHAPKFDLGSLVHNLGLLAPLAPKFGAFALSFVVLAVIWVNHHHFFHALKGIDKHLLWHNNHLLFWVCVIPFVTAVAGENLGEPVATALYGAVSFMMSVAFSSMIRYAFFRCNLLPGEVSLQERRKQFQRSLFGPLVYFLATVLAFFWPWVSIILYISVMAFYFLPNKIGEVVEEAVGGMVVDDVQ